MPSLDALTRMVLGPLARRSEAGKPSAGAELGRAGSVRPRLGVEPPRLRATASIEGATHAPTPTLELRASKPSESRQPLPATTERARSSEPARGLGSVLDRPLPLAAAPRKPERASVPAPSPTRTPTPSPSAPSRTQVHERVLERVIERSTRVVQGRDPRASSRRARVRTRTKEQPLAAAPLRSIQSSPLRSASQAAARATKLEPIERRPFVARVDAPPRAASPTPATPSTATRKRARAAGRAPVTRLERPLAKRSKRPATKPTRSAVEPHPPLSGRTSPGRSGEGQSKREPSKPSRAQGEARHARPSTPTSVKAPTKAAAPARARKSTSKPAPARPRPLPALASRPTPPPAAAPRISVAIGRIEIRSKSATNAGKPSARRAGAPPRAHAIAIRLPGAL